MARYKLLAKSFIPRAPGQEAVLLPAGTEIEFEGNPGSNLELVKGEKAPDPLVALRRKAKSLGVKHDDKTSAEDLDKAIKEAAAKKVP